MISASASPQWPGNDSYSQWLRDVLSAAKRSPQRPRMLFDSSTAEPTALLADLTARAFTAPVTSRYQSTFAGGNPHVVAALATRYGVEDERILCTAGATAGIGVVFRAYLAPGDHVLIECPGFDLFADIAGSMSAEIGYFARAPDGSIDLGQLERAIKPTTRLIVLSNLHNPTGMPLDDVALLQVATLAERHGVDVLVDEVYREYASAPPGSAAHLAPNVIVVNSLTKVFGLSALRCGWIIAHPTRLGAIRVIQSRLEFGASKVSHAVAALVLEDPQMFEAHWRAMLAAARPVIAERFAAWEAQELIAGRLPDHGCICFPELIAVPDTRRFSEWLAETRNVIVAPGEYFGRPGHVRLGFSCDATLLGEALDKLGDALLAHRGRRARRALV